MVAKNKIDIDIKEINKVDNKIMKKKIGTTHQYEFTVPTSSKLVLSFSGSDNDHIVVNTLRRVALDDIPIFAFHKDLIKISANNSVFNNDYLVLRFSQLPIINVKNDLYYLEEKYWKNVDFSDPKREIHPSEINIEAALNVYNDTNQIRNVTTNDLRFYQDNNEIPFKYNTDCPILLVQLRPAETIKCSFKACLGVGELDAIFSAANNVYYDDNTTDEITGKTKENKNNLISLFVESNGQMSEYDILIKACNNIIHRLNLIKKQIDNKIKTKLITPNKEMIFYFEDEDHTLCNILNFAFQNHKNIIYSGVGKPDHLQRLMHIKIACDDSLKNPVDAMFDQIDYLIELYNIILDKIKKLSK